MVLVPEHELVRKSPVLNRRLVKAYVEAVATKSDMDRTSLIR